MTKDIHGDVGSIIAQMVKNIIQGQELVHNLDTTENGVLEYQGHRRILLDDIAKVGNQVVATTDTGTKYFIEVTSDTPVARVDYDDEVVSAQYVLRRANVSIQVAGGHPMTIADAMFGYHVPSGSIAVFAGNGGFIRRSSTVRSFEVDS